MKTIHIKDKLESMGVVLEGISMGDFDYIGEFTAKRQRGPNDENYNKYGAFYRANYERGILIYYLIRQFNLTSMMEIGFGRGFATFCAARAFHDAGIPGKIVTMDPQMDEKFIQALTQVFPREWFGLVQLRQGPSEQVIPQLEGEMFDLVYIDGDHSFPGVQRDWELIKDKWNKFVLFDDYHLPSKNDPGIQCNQAIDAIDDDSKELIILDRRLFFDDRRFTDEQIDYGQVLLTKAGMQEERDDW